MIKKTNKENIFQITVDELLPARVSGFICPKCGAGTREHGTGIEVDKKNSNRLKCYSCGCVFYISNSFISNSLCITGPNCNNMVANTDFSIIKDTTQEKTPKKVDKNFILSSIYSKAINTSQAVLLEWCNFIFQDRGFSDSTLLALMSCPNVKLIYDEYYNQGNAEEDRNNEILIPIYDVSYREIIGVQRLYVILKKTKEQTINKLTKQIRIDNKGIFPLENKIHPNVFFFVESVTNALAIYELGYSSIVFFTKSNIEETARKLYIAGKKNEIVLFLDFDAREKQHEIAEKFGMQEINWKELREKIDKDPLSWLENKAQIEEDEYYKNKVYKTDASDLIQSYSFTNTENQTISKPLIEKEFLSQILDNAYNKAISLQLQHIENKSINECLSQNRVNVVFAPTGAGKTDAIENLWSKKHALYMPSIKLVESFAKKKQANYKHSKNKSFAKANQGFVTTHKRLDLNVFIREYGSSSLEDLLAYEDHTIDEFHLLLEWQEQTLIKPYAKPILDIEQNEEPYIDAFTPIYSNENFATSIIKSQVEFFPFSNTTEQTQEMISFEFDRKRENPIPKYNQIMTIDRRYTYDELLDPKTYEYREQNQNFYAHILPCNSLNMMLDIDIEHLRDSLKIELGTKNTRVFFAFLSHFMNHAFVACAFPEVIENDKRVPLNIYQYQEYIKTGREKEILNNHNKATFFQPKAKYLNFFPLVKLLKILKINPNAKLNLMTATPPEFWNTIYNEIEETIGKENITIQHLSSKRKFCYRPNIIIQKENFSSPKMQGILVELAKKKESCLIVLNKKEQARTLALHQKQEDFEKQGCEVFSYLEEDYEHESREHPLTNNTKRKIDIITYGRHSSLVGSNLYKKYRCIFLDASLFDASFADFTPYKTVDQAIQDRIQIMITQILGRPFREDNVNEVIAIWIFNSENVIFDLHFLEEFTQERINPHYAKNGFNFGNTDIEISGNVDALLLGVAPTQYPIKRQLKEEKTEEQKEQEKYTRALNNCIKKAKNEIETTGKKPTWAWLYKKCNLNRIPKALSIKKELEKGNLLK